MADIDSNVSPLIKHPWASIFKATRKTNVGLNSTKFQFKQKSVSFFGHTITPEGIQPSNDKVEAIRNIQTPTNTTDLLTILGMITYLNRYSTKLAQLTSSLRDLMKENAHFKWEDQHHTALNNIKKELFSVLVMSYYDANRSHLTTDHEEFGNKEFIVTQSKRPKLH